MHSYALAADLYELKAFEDDMREMTMLIVVAAHLTAEAMPLLRDITRLRIRSAMD